MGAGEVGPPQRRNVRAFNHWVAGGEDVWTSSAGWNTTCDPSACSIATEGLGRHTRWQTAGHGLPNSAVNNVTIGPDGRTVYAATHGGGIWSFTVR